MWGTGRRVSAVIVGVMTVDDAIESPAATDTGTAVNRRRRPHLSGLIRWPGEWRTGRRRPHPGHPDTCPRHADAHPRHAHTHTGRYSRPHFRRNCVESDPAPFHRPIFGGIAKRRLSSDSEQN